MTDNETSRDWDICRAVDLYRAPRNKGDDRTLTDFLSDVGLAIDAQPEYLFGCQLRGPGECQKEGKCISEACVHYNKTERRPRMTVLAQVDGILYPKVET